jgi:hypothetical protein
MRYYKRDKCDSISCIDAMINENINVSNYDFFVSFGHNCMINDDYCGILMKWWFHKMKNNIKKCHNIVDIIMIFVIDIKFNKSKFFWRLDVVSYEKNQELVF